MSKIFLVLEREFLTRVRKKSFIIMTILAPLLFAGLMVVPMIIATMDDTKERSIAVIDDSGLFKNKITETEYLKFVYLDGVTVSDIQSTFSESGYYAVLYIGSMVANTPDAVILYSDKQPSMDITSHISSAIKNEIETQKLKTYDIENLDDILKSIKTNVRVRTIKWSKDGEAKESSSELVFGLAYILSFLVYMLIFMFGSQVMRGVIEEKTSRVVEVIVSSVKPFQLMMGKILGIAAVSLLQIVIWLILTFGLVSAAGSIFLDSSKKVVAQKETVTNLMEQAGVAQTVTEAADQPSFANEMMTALSNINFVLIIGGFIFFFIGGYLLYAAMFAAVGSAVDSEADTQQLILPVTIPLILAIVVMVSGLKSPDGSLTFWFSIIPFTSPIIMITRLPYGVPTWELALSAALLVISFVAITWLAAKIYRVGILLYGKKHTWKEMWKWIKYKN
ncbi:MAG TPA: ABC transporter permease [Tenuifilaceae bacterium]|nr:ABC transporter permease [Bacteroidales bacterium]OQC64025.1 MAG: ABC-2 family transporter protein [Bacteroidetes bacterium ADurb.Bin008]HOF92238.1 ABC transporter permease [Tenuifilaceae bacterium]HOM86120.1 ABC transporter permease [Tenuifilaceae bacterium]HOQ35816.1 ABC transporter permease [Tenuifilaceae bacterium]